MASPGYNQGGLNISGQFGMPLYGIQGVLPPFSGNSFWVDETNGSDGNTGGPQDPFATLTQALSKCANNNNDVVYLVGTVHVTATVAWNKSRTHLIGLAPTLDSEARARISQTGTTVFSPLVNVTGSECIFMNIGSFHGFVDLTNQICWANAASRNQYHHCAFLGMGNATGGASQTGSRSLTVGAGDENTFTNCIIGLDTIARSAANASLEFLSGSARNVFRNCVFPCLTTSASAVFVTVGAAGMDRFALFDGCTFINAIESTSTTMSAAITANAAAGGAILLTPTTISLGATAIATTGPVYFVGMNPGGANSASAGSIAIKAT
jgi:hypothetical protein